VRVIGVAALALWLAACQTLKPLSSEAPVWEMTGRMALKTATQGWSADLHWIQRRDVSEVIIQGPLGLGRVVLRWTATAVTVDSAQGVTTYAWDDPALQQFMRTQLLIPLPLASLPYWFRGERDPQLEGESRADGFSQAGWDVHLTPTNAQGSMLQKIELTQGNVRLRLIVDHWDER